MSTQHAMELVDGSGTMPGTAQIWQCTEKKLRRRS